MATETIQEFLVSLRYGVDQTSQQNFIGALINVAKQVNKVVGEAAALTAAIIGMGRVMAETGEQAYWMSRRIGSSVEGIQAATYAMSQFGVSASQARTALETLGNWQARMGPAGSAFLKGMMGVTAGPTTPTGTVQIGAFLRNMGLRPDQIGTMGYARALQYAQMLGLTPQEALALADPQYAQRVRQQQGWAGLYGGAFFGTGPGAAPGAMQDQWAKVSTQFMQTSRSLGGVFMLMQQAFAAELLPKLTAQLQTFIKAFTDPKNVPAIVDWLKKAADAVANFSGTVFRLLAEGVDIVRNLAKAFQDLDPWVQSIIQWVGVLSRRWLALIGILLFFGDIMQDVRNSLADPTNKLLTTDPSRAHEKGVHRYDWSWVKQVSDWFGSWNDWLKNVTGLKDPMADLLASIAAIVVFGPRIWGIAKGFWEMGKAAWYAAKGIWNAGKWMTGLIRQQAVLDALQGLGGPAVAAAVMTLQLAQMVGGAKIPPMSQWEEGSVWWNGIDPKVKEAEMERRRKRRGTTTPDPSEVPPDTDSGGGFTSEPDFGKLSQQDYTPGQYNPLTGESTTGGGDTNVDTSKGDEGSRTVAANMTGNAKEAFDFLNGLFRSPAAAIGVINNLMQESSLNPDAGEAETPGGHYGIAQWSYERQQLFKALTGGTLKGTNLKTQLMFLAWELNNKYPGVLGKLTSPGETVEAATRDFETGFEAPGDDQAEYEKRIGFTRSVMGAIGNPLLPGGMQLAIPGGPLAAAGGGGGGGMGGGIAMGGGSGVTLNQTTNITVAAGPTAAETAQRVAGNQTRVNERLARSLQAVLT